MPRHNYPLTRETVKVLNGSAQAVAEEMSVSPTAIYNILESNTTDPFSKFEFMYAAAVRAGCDVSHWDNRLAVIRAKNKKQKPHLSPQMETAALIKEAADVAAAVLRGENLHKQLLEITEEVDQGLRTRTAIIMAIASEDWDVSRNGNK